MAKTPEAAASPSVTGVAAMAPCFLPCAIISLASFQVPSTAISAKRAPGSAAASTSRRLAAPGAGQAAEAATAHDVEGVRSQAEPEDASGLQRPLRLQRMLPEHDRCGHWQRVIWERVADAHTLRPRTAGAERPALRSVLLVIIHRRTQLVFRRSRLLTQLHFLSGIGPRAAATVALAVRALDSANSARDLKTK
eukprot:scaffold36351_cov65-Phaeocystis_antarctica.AAC.4